MNCETMTIVWAKRTGLGWILENVIITAWKLKCFKTQLQRGWNPWKQSGGRINHGLRLARPSFKLRLWKFHQLPVLIWRKKHFLNVFYFFVFQQQCFQQTLWRWWWHNFYYFQLIRFWTLEKKDMGKIFFWHYSIKIIGNFLICFLLRNWFFSIKFYQIVF